MGLVPGGGFSEGLETVNSIFFLLPIALILGGIFAALFVKAARDGQFDDLDDPPKRMLQD